VTRSEVGADRSKEDSDVKFEEPDEKVLYQLKKSKLPIVVMIVLVPLFSYFGYFLLAAAIRVLFLGDSSVAPLEAFLAGLVVLAVVVPLLLTVVFSYAFTGLVVTDKRIYVRKSLSGRTIDFTTDAVRSFQHVVASGRNSSNHAICFYLSCGRQVQTGNLNATLRNLQELLELLRARYEGRGFTAAELADMTRQNPQAPQPYMHTNWIVKGVYLVPWILALAWTARYLFF